MQLFIEQTNGLTERLNQTLSRSLIKIINEDQDDWDKKLDSILFAYRAAKHRTTGYSPFFMLYHREPRLPIDTELMPDKKSGDDPDICDYATTMLSVCNSLKSEAMKNITNAQQYQKRYYDKKHGYQVCTYRLQIQPYFDSICMHLKLLITDSSRLSL